MMKRRVFIWMCSLALAFVPMAGAHPRGGLGGLPTDPQAELERGVNEWLLANGHAAGQDLASGRSFVPGGNSIAPTNFVAAAQGSGTWRCFPTCDAADGRFLTLAGSAHFTLAGGEVVFRLAVPSGAPSFTLGIFDGDSSGYWDFPPNAATSQLIYSVYADPLGDGSGTDLVWQQSGASMPDNTWFDVSIPTSVAAQSPAGAFFYVLRVEIANPNVTVFLSSFKVRTTGIVSLQPEAFNYMAPLFNFREIGVIYPNSGMGDLSTTTYDGSWDFHMDVVEGLTSLTIWDGDFDFGSADNVDLDTDDPDTPGAPFLPTWALGTTARPEGVAQGLPCSGEASLTGCPADDRSPGIWRRQPSVMYEVMLPTGEVFINDNPSGNQEWEQFRLDTAPFNRAIMDHHVAQLPSGIYHIHLRGVDLTNLNAFKPAAPLLCMTDTGEICEPVRPFVIGDRVWLDSDGDGIQDPIELGINGVSVTHINDQGYAVDGAITAGDGMYLLPVEAGTHDVQVDVANFAPGGALYGMVSTTGGDLQTYTVTNANVLTFDFGYRPANPPGTGTIGYWKTHPQAWPVSSITIGGVSYTKSQAIAIMNTPGRGDKTYDLFAQLVAAKLNVYMGNESSCVEDAIMAADAWLVANPVGSNVRGRKWQPIEPVHALLDSYNNGNLCAPSRG